MDFIREYNEILYYSTQDIYDLEYDNNKLNVVASQLELIYDKISKLNHDKFYEYDDLKGIIYWLSGHTYTIKKVSDEEVIDYVCDILLFTTNDLVILLEEYELWEFCRNILNITDLIIKDLKNEAIV